MHPSETARTTANTATERVLFFIREDLIRNGVGEDYRNRTSTATGQFIATSVTIVHDVQRASVDSS